MSLSMYEASIPVFTRMLGNLSTILDKAAAHAEAQGIEPAVFLNSRLAPDMFPLMRQVQIATDSVKGCAARLAQLEVPPYADTEASFPELQERIARTLGFIQEIRPEQIDGSEGRTVVLKMRGSEVSFPGQAFLLNFSLPNFYFHITTAYNILRHNGVKIGKMDFLGGV